MTNLTKLKEVIDNSGLKLGFLALQMGISQQTLYNKLNGNTKTFTIREVFALKKVLKLTDEEIEEIFLPERVKENH